MSETMDPKYDISIEGRKLVKDYQASLEETKRSKQAHNRAVTAEANARRALVKWCAPADAKPGEKFGIWCRDQYGNEVLIEVQTEWDDNMGTDGEGPITVRRHEGTVNLRYRK